MEPNICDDVFSYSDIISLIALIVSIVSVLFNIIFTIYKNRRKISCNKLSFWRYQSNNKNLFEYCLTLVLENKSELPISIVSIKIKVNDNVVENSPNEVFLYGGGYPTVYGKHKEIEVFTDVFPIGINPLSSKIVRAYFVFDKEINPNEIKNIIFETTRNNIKFRNLSISDKQY